MIYLCVQHTKYSWPNAVTKHESNYQEISISTDLDGKTILSNTSTVEKCQFSDNISYVYAWSFKFSEDFKVDEYIDTTKLEINNNFKFDVYSSEKNGDYFFILPNNQVYQAFVKKILTSRFVMQYPAAGSAQCEVNGKSIVFYGDGVFSFVVSSLDMKKCKVFFTKEDGEVLELSKYGSLDENYSKILNKLTGIFCEKDLYIPNISQTGLFIINIPKGVSANARIGYLTIQNPEVDRYLLDNQDIEISDRIQLLY
jgi:hypothetical protein